MTTVQYTIYFTSIGGYEAKITGDEPAIHAIEEAFERAGIRFDKKVETWDEGFYHETNLRTRRGR